MSSSRNSSSSTRSPMARRQVNLSTIEKSVTHLLVATKQLLETLTAWSRGNATEAEVSDVYVRLGSEFNVACRAFTAIGVETADLGNVPDALRTILESTLSQDASPASLDVYLPRIRDIIINLLQGLKEKQIRLRQRQGSVREGEAGPSTPRRHRGNGSGSSTSGGGLAGVENGELSGSGSPRGISTGPPPEQQSRVKSNESITNGTGEDGANAAPPRSSSLPQNAPSVRGQPPYPSSVRGSTRSHASSSSTSSSTSTAGASANVTANTTISPVSATGDVQSFQSALPPQYFAPPLPPPPPEPQENPLMALQRESALERRASRRYSAFHFAKLTGTSPNVPAMPTVHPSPTPRHRETPDSMIDASRVRQSIRMRPAQRNEMSPMRRNRISEEKDEPTATSIKSPVTPIVAPVTPVTPKPVEAEGPVPPPKDTDLRKQPILKVDTSVSPPSKEPVEAVNPATPPRAPPEDNQVTSPSPPPASQEVAEAVRPTSQPSLNTKEITIFLQIGRSIKKAVLPDGIEDSSLTSIRLLFISKFNYNPPAGEDFPEIYLQDPVSGVRYELEDMHDVKDRSVLCLNVEVLDEVKRHIDDGIGSLRKLVEGVKGMVDGQKMTLQRVAERQEEAAKKIAELSVAPPTALVLTPPTPISTTAPQTAPALTDENRSQLAEIRDLRRDLAVLRQVYSSFVSDVNNSMSSIKEKAAAVKTSTENAKAAAVLSSAPGAGRAYVEDGKKTLGADADALVTRVDDLQDTVEELRKDVVSRGVRPLGRQLEAVSKDLAQAKIELRKMAEFIKKEKPKWKKVWEKELEVVCDDQQFFNMQEELITDLQDDLDKASQTFALVEQCSEQQIKAGHQNAGPGSLTSSRNPSRGFQNLDDGPVDVGAIKHNVLSEVRALQPNHENRLEAIERAEKLRQKELEGRVPEFKKELGSFVEQGKLRKAGGVEEAERQRKLRDEAALKEAWALKNGKGKGKMPAGAADIEPPQPQVNGNGSGNGEAEDAATVPVPLGSP